LHRKFSILLRNNHGCKVVDPYNARMRRNNLYFHRKFSILLRNDCDCKAVDPYNARKRYAVIESLNHMKNIPWLADCFCKIKKPNTFFS
jgi:hypothetical protein